MESKDKKESKFDIVQVLLVVISISMLTYSSVYLFNYYNNNDILHYYPKNTKSTNDKLLSPNEIGDSIGGILNPIIGITGSILTFLAFYIQYKANKEQKKYFFIGLDNEKQKRIIEKNQLAENERKNHVTNIKILKSLITSILINIEKSDPLTKKFILEEKEKPLAAHIFNFSTNASYEYFKKLDFKDFYDSILYSFANKNEDWENDFIEVLNILDFYEKLLQEMKSTYFIHSQSKVEALNEIGRTLTKEIGNVLNDVDLKDLNGVQDYIAIVNNRNAKNEPIVPDNEFEPGDFSKIQDIFLTKYLEHLYKRFKETNDEKFVKQLELFSGLNKQIWAVKFGSEKYVKNLQSAYDNYFADQIRVIKIKEFLDRINLD